MCNPTYFLHGFYELICLDAAKVHTSNHVCEIAGSHLLRTRATLFSQLPAEHLHEELQTCKDQSLSPNFKNQTQSASPRKYNGAGHTEAGLIISINTAATHVASVAEISKYAGSGVQRGVAKHTYRPSSWCSYLKLLLYVYSMGNITFRALP